MKRDQWNNLMKLVTCKRSGMFIIRSLYNEKLTTKGKPSGNSVYISNPQTKLQLALDLDQTDLWFRWILETAQQPNYIQKYSLFAYMYSHLCNLNLYLNLFFHNLQF